MRLDGPLIARRGRRARLIAVVVQADVRLRLVIGRLPESGYAAKQSLEDIARPS